MTRAGVCSLAQFCSLCMRIWDHTIELLIMCEQTSTNLAPLEEVDCVVVSRAMRSRMNGLLGSGNLPTTKLCPGSGALSTNTCHAHETWMTHCSMLANNKGAAGEARVSLYIQLLPES